MTVIKNNCAFLDKYQDSHVEPLWTVMEAMVPPNPNPKCVPHLWEYEKLRPALLEAGENVSDEEAERRVLMLVNPNRCAPYTSDTLYAGLQLILPGETATAHRHRAFALRFIIEGENGFTAVEGEKIYMSKGDLILTPPFTWHDHGHEGTTPMIWLDGLDLPIFQSIPVNFAEAYSEKRYPSETAENSSLKFPWTPVQKSLDQNLNEAYSHFSYIKPNGEPISKIIGGEAWRLTNGKCSNKRRETCSKVVHIYSGEGYTEIVDDQGNAKTIEWKVNDTFVIPAWYWVTHHALKGEMNDSVYAFAFNDLPLIESLGLHKVEEIANQL